MTTTMNFSLPYCTLLVTKTLKPNGAVETTVFKNARPTNANDTKSAEAGFTY